MKHLLKIIGMAAAGGAIGAVVKVLHTAVDGGGNIDPHQLLTLALTGALGGILGLYQQPPQDAEPK